MSSERRGLSIVLALMLASILPPASGLFSVRRTSDVVVIGEGERLADDLIVLAADVRIEGTVDGDVIAFTDRLSVTGSVSGDLLGFARHAAVSGEVLGSVRLAGGELEIGGGVGKDVTTAMLRLTVMGQVGRDVYGWGRDLVIGGQVGRDVAGRFAGGATLSGSVGRDFEAVTPRLQISDAASVGGTLVVRSDAEAAISDTAEVGRVVYRSGDAAPLQVRAVRLLILVVGAIAFALLGVAVFLLFPTSLRLATDRLRRRPWSTLIWGLTVVAVPFGVVGVTAVVGALAPVMIAAPALAVMLPMSISLVILLLLGVAVAPVPVLSTLGRLALPRWSPAAAFVAAAAAWALLLLLPWIGPAAAGLVILWGLGAWSAGARGARGDATWAFAPGPGDD